MSALGLPSMAIFTPFCALRERSYKGGWVSSDNIASYNGYYRKQYLPSKETRRVPIRNEAGSLQPVPYAFSAACTRSAVIGM